MNIIEDETNTMINMISMITNKKENIILEDKIMTMIEIIDFLTTKEEIKITIGAITKEIMIHTKTVRKKDKLARLQNLLKLKKMMTVFHYLPT